MPTQGKTNTVTAEALEQSVLESKDKTQLIQIADALGVKANSRSKKADIIEQILAKTGGSNGSSEASNGDGAADAPKQNGAAPASDPKPTDEPAPAPEASEPAAADSAPAADAAPEPEAGSEPKAEWELALEVGGGADEAPEPAGDPGGATGSAAPADAQAADVTSDDGKTDAASDGGKPDAKSDDGARRDGKNGQGGNRQGGGQRNQNNQNNQQGDQGESRNKRRRRRRKGRGGQDGPQGEDRDLLEGDDESTSSEPVQVEGYLDMRDEGYGFLRVNNYLSSKSDSYIPVKLSRQFGLRKGDHVVGMSRPAGRNEKNPAMLEITTVNGRPPEEAKKRPRFEDLTALFPDEKLQLEDGSDPANMTARIIDLVSPIGKGQPRPDRLAAQGRQDHGHADDRQLDRAQQLRVQGHRVAHRRAARGGHRVQAHGARRSHRVHLRQAERPAHPDRRDGDREGQAGWSSTATTS